MASGKMPPLGVALAALIVTTGYLGLPGATAGIIDDSPEDPFQAPIGPHASPLDAAGIVLDDLRDRDVTDAHQDAIDVQEHQLRLAEHALAVHDDEDRTADEATFEIARGALDNRQALLEDDAPPSVLDGLQQQRENIDLAEHMAQRANPPATLAHAVDVLEASSAWQAATLGWQAPTQAAPLTDPTLTPSEAVDELAQRHDVELTDEQRDALEEMEDLPAPVRTQLAVTLEAHLALDQATRDALDGIETFYGDQVPISQVLDWIDEAQDDRRLAEHAPTPVGDLVTPREHVDAIGLDFSQVLEERLRVMATLTALDEALDAAPETALDSHETVRIPGVAALDLAGEDSTYTEDYAFQIDAGGDDAYHNNAGGSNLNEGSCAVEDTAGASLLVDLGGSDTFGHPHDRRSCGVNGGALNGVGILVSTAGDDAFLAGGTGTNGGALTAGLGLIVSLEGDDRFDAGSFSTNGGGVDAAAGLILDLAGDTEYTGGAFGANGAGAEGGAGAIVDLAGDDAYHAAFIGVNGAGDGYLLGGGAGAIVDPAGDRDEWVAAGGGNGGGSRVGAGFLYNGPGDAVYEAEAFGANGGANNQGVGMLLDAGGENRFEAEYVAGNGGAASQGVSFLINLGHAEHYITTFEGDGNVAGGGWQGFNGGAYDGGVAFLFNAQGGSLFEARSGGVNGGASGDATALLVSGEGADTFVAKSGGANGGGDGSNGMIVNAGGQNAYIADSGSVNGGASGDEASGAILDLAGDDTYVSDGRAANGGARGGGLGLLFDASGDDAYHAENGGVNGGADALSYALLLDGGGEDYYEDDEGGTGWDQTVAPKGAIGAQVDLDRP